MTLPTSGALTLAQIQGEFGGSNPIGLNEYYAGGGLVPAGTSGTYGAVPSSGAIGIRNFYGTSNRVTANITISANTANYTLNTAKVTGYSAGLTDVTLTINSGVTVYSASTGTAAFIVDTSWAAGDTVTIVNGGTILGCGGNGGTYSSSGAGGGLGLQIQRATTITNNNRIAGGGGGGGGGGSPNPACTGLIAGGGGGGGIGNGAGGGGGGAGTLTAAGSGASGSSVAGDCLVSETPYAYDLYSGSGGSGGTYGSSGSAGEDGGATVSAPCCTPGSATAGGGGAGGGAVSGNTNITWIATGTRNGSIT